MLVVDRKPGTGKFNWKSAGQVLEIVCKIMFAFYESSEFAFKFHAVYCYSFQTHYDAELRIMDKVRHSLHEKPLKFALPDPFYRTTVLKDGAKIRCASVIWKGR